MCIRDSFLTYKSGFYEALQPSRFELEMEHVVKVIGWSENKGKTCWQIQNSWGTDWGENGSAFVCTKLSPVIGFNIHQFYNCLLYTSPSPRDLSTSRMPSSA
eukprot:TRINITY_DN20750_c0_g1_i1.p1 TRINITY_DN20750_c0_g1~~TRINITY_DN20750_c0_g1_i1.p1  ORF type:complete len:102 (-),score=13.19 TRINITY_DN20750_c0_g1_i1:93-398(-)